jgi:hypothetical protein
MSSNCCPYLHEKTNTDYYCLSTRSHPIKREYISVITYCKKATFRSCPFYENRKTNSYSKSKPDKLIISIIEQLDDLKIKKKLSQEEYEQITQILKNIKIRSR